MSLSTQTGTVMPVLARSMASDNDLQHDLSLALHTITETNQSIRFADTKAGALAGAQAVMVTVLATHDDEAAFRMLRAVCFLAVLISALLLAAGQAPRIFELRGRPSRVSFPALARLHADELLELPSLERRHEEAWRQAASLARIAVTKFRWLTRAAASTVLTLAAVLAWLTCVTWPSAG
jgi:hypothetical protein